jgi:hypothetical protein
MNTNSTLKEPCPSRSRWYRLLTRRFRAEVDVTHDAATSKNISPAKPDFSRLSTEHAQDNLHSFPANPRGLEHNSPRGGTQQFSFEKQVIPSVLPSESLYPQN